jgi:hypothetical protein
LSTTPYWNGLESPNIKKYFPDDGVSELPQVGSTELWEIIIFDSVMNCFACHAQARPEFDLICEQGHGCDPIPVTRAMSAALQRTDPRCKDQQPVSAEDAQALKDLVEVFKALKATKDTDKQ